MRAFALKDWWIEKGCEAEVFRPLEILLLATELVVGCIT